MNNKGNCVILVATVVLYYNCAKNMRGYKTLEWEGREGQEWYGHTQDTTKKLSTAAAAAR